MGAPSSEVQPTAVSDEAEGTEGEMTAEELATELYQRQGYLVGEYPWPLEIGAVLGCFSHMGTIRPPVRVVDVSTREKMTAQRELSQEITGRKAGKIKWNNFYLIEACD